MEFLGLLSVNVPVYDLVIQEKWLRSFLYYKAKLGEFVFQANEGLMKISGYISSQGGMPIFFSQQVNGIDGSRRINRDLYDLGVLAFKFRVSNFYKFYLENKLSHRPVSRVLNHNFYGYVMWLTDACGNKYQVVQWPYEHKLEMPEFFGLVISVHDIEKAADLFCKLGYDEIVYTQAGFFEDLEAYKTSTQANVVAKRIILRSSKNHRFAKFFGVSEIELVEFEEFNRKSESKYSLYFLVTQAYKKPDFFIPQFRVYDNDMITALVSDVDLKHSFPYLDIKVVEMRKLKLRGGFDIDFDDTEPIPPKKISFLFKNVLEKS